MEDIFISYAREDRLKAEELAKVFEEQKWSVWWDRELYPGDEVGDVIARQLASAKAVVVLWSGNSVNSDWVRDEAQEGRDRKVLVPVLISKTSIPLGFRQIQAANLTDWGGSPADIDLRLLLRKIGNLIDKPPVAREPTAAERVKYFLKRRAALLVAGAALLLLLGWVAVYQKWPRRQVVVNNDNLGGRGGGKGDGKEAEERAALDRAIKYTTQGLGIAAEGNYAGALLYYEQAIGAYPKYPSAYFHRGQSYVTLQKDDLAVADFKTFLTLVNDASNPNRQEAEGYLAQLVRPRQVNPRQVNPRIGAKAGGAPGDSVQGAGGDAGTSGNMSLAPPLPPGPAGPLIEQMFSEDKATRIAATTKLIIERKRDESIVSPAVAKALSQTGNKSGVINVLVLLESMPPEVIRRHGGELKRLFGRVKGNGTQTAEHIDKLMKVLNG